MTVDAIVIGAGLRRAVRRAPRVSAGPDGAGHRGGARASAAPGTGTAIPARAATSKVSTTPTLSTRTCRTSWTWTERFAAQPEILAYLDHVADRFDLRRHYLFDTEVVGARFDERAGEWVVQTSAGESRRARFLLCATGCLSAVNRPDIPGLADFAGEVYYTAAWPREDPDLRGKRIGVIGTGSSGIQAVPILAAQAESLVVFQRSPNYTVPMPNHPLVGRGRGTHPPGVPGAQAAFGVRAAQAHRTARTTRTRWTRIPRRGSRRCGGAGATAGCFSPRRSPIRRRCWQPTTSRVGSPRTASARSSPTPRSPTT